MNDANMTDKLGRVIDYLRLSITNKCNLNCTYCKHATFAAEDLISFSEIERVVRLFAECGIRKIRLTGGEPLVREDIFDIVKVCKDTKGIKETTLTTNGVLLADKAEGLKAAGLSRINVSIDSLEPKQYKQIARAESLGKVLEGVDAALEAGLNPVKINAVLIRGENDNEIDNFIALTKDKEVQVRFIEYMPMGGPYEEKYLSAEEVVAARPWLEKQEESKGVETIYHVAGHKGKVGFITPISRPFCHECNRVRVTADCKIRHCLGSNLEVSLREILKNDDEKALGLIKETVAQKPEKGFCSGFETSRGMGNLGG